jgi:heptosyltransferase I
LNTPLESTAPWRILIVRLSSLGDVIHVMPAVQDLLRTFPNAVIDWVVEPAFASIVSRCNGIHRIIECPIRRWRKSIFSKQTRNEWLAFRKNLQEVAYDIVLDAHGLTKSALIAWMAKINPNGARYAMANQTECSSYEFPTRWPADKVIFLPWHVHAVTRSRILFSKALNYEIPEDLLWGLLPKISSDIPTGLTRYVFFAHGSSRADKTWPIEHWIELGYKLREFGLGVVFSYGNEQERGVSNAIAAALGVDAIVWPAMTVSDLMDRMACCFGLIGVDSGLSHIAVAIGIPHIQIYNFPTNWRTGPIGSFLTCQRSVYAEPSPSVHEVWQAWRQII